MAKQITLSVVIPTCNRAGRITECLDALSAQARGLWRGFA